MNSSEVENLKENVQDELKLDCTNLNELEKKVEKYKQVVKNYLVSISYQKV